MSLTETDIIAALERAECLIPEIPGFLDYLAIPGITASTMDDPHPVSNRICNARLNSANVSDAIEAAIKFYTALGRGFSWAIGPGSTPADLGQRLADAGFERAFDTEGLYLTSFNVPIIPNPDYVISEISINDPEPVIEVISRGFNTSEESTRKFNEMLRLCQETILTRIFAAHTTDSNRIIACAYLTYYPDVPIALMGGAATLEEYRGRGLYTALMAHRLAAARRDNIEAVIVLADSTTSGPICKKIGFKKACDVHVYVWDVNEKRAD